ncbi:Phosphopantetheine adenylyltransferase [Paucidesulfovibrio gracilis DSM 16080]|uniref:Phosphopantetheine adenylyltransferase n=1 Tax=Paucidesulfovibrio gracilis DSM 16080 TaxID=1121449 RepID=A0A1T4WU29_9BACT|nr:pantetheine-phosphate adenylyltransferase [Paucidesulfovibrio gracilis]SKA80375.1 Phosphopantetheine adenylyltransferase [Paucidesulfovibrio gracilis DSM 16080]
MAQHNSRLAIYPGTFDPLTNGHVSLIRRGTKIFDTVVFAVARSTSKNTLFSLEERVALAREALGNFRGILVEPFDGLLVDYARRRGAGAILRGMRAVSDFEYEFQMALMNRKLNKDVETVFLMTDFKWMYLSSTIVKDVARNGGSIKGLVPECVITPLYKRCEERRRQALGE